jgi:hypothetical protein
MDVWEVPVSSCPGLDRGPLMDVGPEQLTQISLRPPVDGTNGTYFSVTPFAILRLISARGFVNQL